MNRIHIVVDDEIMNLLELYKKNNKYSYSKTVSELMKSAVSKENLIKEIETINRLVNNINNKHFLILDLLKQLYSDLEIENITNPGDNKVLMEFFYKRENK